MLKPVVVLLLGCSIIVVSEAGRVFLPDQLNHDEHGPCDTHLNTVGTCERSCDHVSPGGELRECAIKNGFFLYCCDPNASRTRGDFTDISPPDSNYVCGKNYRNLYFFTLPFDGDPIILRPNASVTLPPSNSDEPPRPAGIPEKAFEEFLNPPPLPDGVFEVVGGIEAEKNGWPWMALVGRRTATNIAWYCGGVLINEQWVLSAVHCYLFSLPEVVRLGEHDYSVPDEGGQPEDYDVEDIFLYPDYIHTEAYHDLALLKLFPKVLLQNHISPICLPWGSESSTVITDEIATLTGWGDTEYGGYPSSILQEVNVTVFSSNQCDRNYSSLPQYSSKWPQGIGEETLCAGDLEGGRDACQGDSGGPLVTQDVNGVFILAGIVSRGYGCGKKDYPGLYVNIRYPPYLAWIKQTAFTP